MKAKILLTLLTCFALFLFGCKKKDPEFVRYTSYLHQNLKNQFYFEENSYWIYEDQLNIMDSVVLVARDTGITPFHPDNAFPRSEYIHMDFRSFNTGDSWNYYLKANHLSYNGGGTWGQNGQPIYILGEDSGTQFNGVIVNEKIDSLLVLNTMFYNVEVMRVEAETQFQIEFEYDKEFYFAPSIGLIQEVTFDTINGTHTKSLKRYKIER